MLPKSLIGSHMRKKVENIVEQAIINKPNDCEDIRIIEKRVYVDKGFMLGGYYETNTFARYKTEDGTKDVEIDKCGDWKYSASANHILQEMNEYHPFSTEEYFKNQGFYESDLDSGLIDKPINNITSPLWEVKKICEYIIKNHTDDDIELILWFDENELNVDRFDSVDYRHNWSDSKVKSYYCAKITIKYGNKTHTTKGGFYSEYISWINRFANALKNHNIKYTVDITDDDYKRLCKMHNWNDGEFEDSRFVL